MKASELRIGNWATIKNYVHFDWERRPKECQVNMFDLNNYIAYHWNGTGEEYYYKLQDCEPIPLTEEWLLKLGFEKNIDWEQQINEYGRFSELNSRRGVGLYLHEREWRVTFREDVGCGWNELNEIEFVHQLQNLYHALTGEELISK